MTRSAHALRHALRSLRRTPGFALAAVLTLAVGIGLSTAVFTVANALLLRPLPVADQERIVLLWGRTPDGRFDHYPMHLADAREAARSAGSLQRTAFAAYEGAWPTPVVDQGQITRLRRAFVSGDFFGLLGVRPALGRTLRPADDLVGAAPVAVISYDAWQSRFGGDSSMLGRRLVMHENGVAVAIVGVMPPGLEYPRGTDFWVPLVPAKTLQGRSADIADVDLVGRLRPGRTPEDARAELSAYFARPDAPESQRGLRAVVHTLPSLILGDTRPALIVFAAAAALLLLITCINVANLLLVRGLGRVREVAVRTALGAGRARIMGQLLTENALLAAAGGVFGVALAAAAVRAFVAFAPAGLPRLSVIRLDGAALAGAVAITALAMLLFALAPAVATSRAELQQLLRSDARQSASWRSRLTTEALVAAQVALAVVVLSAAALIGRSLLELQRVDLALEPSHVLIGELALRSDRFTAPGSQLALLERLLPAVRAVPGVRAASPVVAAPYSGTGGWDGHLAAEGQSAEDAARNPILNMEVVAPEYFATFGIRLLEGRSFTAADREGAPAAVMLSESAARHFWPAGGAVGKRLTMRPGQGPWFTVAGVVPDTRYRELREARPSIYFPLRQSIFPFVPLTLAVRTTGQPAAVAPAVRRAVAEVDPGVDLVSAAPYEQYLDAPLAQPRLNALLLAIFAAAAMALAAVGLFGVMATMVRQRTREFGVRMALGATGRDVRWMVMRRGLAVALVGMAAGLAAALAADRLLASLLFQVSPTDSLTLAAVAVSLLVIAALATIIPARTGTRIDPAVALRTEG